MKEKLPPPPQENCTAPPFPHRQIDSRKTYLLSKNLLKLKAYVIPGKTPPRKPLEK